MQSRYAVIAAAIFCVLGLCEPLYAQESPSERAARTHRISILIALATPDSLASAALLAALGDTRKGKSLDLIRRAVALAPARAELVWEARELCEKLKCSAAQAIDTQLKGIDSENGFVWLSDLKRAQEAGPAADVTTLVGRIGASARMTIYWNKLEVMFVDALAAKGQHPNRQSPERDFAAHAVYAIGLLAELVIPSMEPLGHACGLPALEEPGRPAACEAMVALLARSDTLITQSVALSIQERWYPAGSPARDAVDTKRRRLDYLIAMSGQERWLIQDVAILIDAARRGEREEDADLAVLKAHGIAPDPPSDWKDASERG
jgi:hypothetical protein